MAGRGPAPKAQRSRTRDNPELTRLVKAKKPVGPGLPPRVLGKDRNGQWICWHPMTKRWWEHWRTSPQASRMLSDADWDFLLDTALMHHQMWSNHRWEFASEIRLRVAKFGATPEDRMRLKAEIETAEKAPAGQVSATATSLQDRRDRLLRAV